MYLLHLKLLADLFTILAVKSYFFVSAFMQMHAISTSCFLKVDSAALIYNH